jgi:putative DNA primase/helicase
MLEGYGIAVRYNTISKELEIRIPGMASSIDNQLESRLILLESLGALNGINATSCRRYLTLIADQNQVNPIAEWIDSRPWDKEDRLEALYATLTVRDEFPIALRNKLIYRWLLSAVAAALTPSGFYCRGVLTLQGPQSIGKTSWIRNLINQPDLRDQYILEGHHLDPANKDTILIAIKHWIVELGELDSSFKKDIARIKGVITNKADKVRRPYAAAASEFQRRTVFAASVNECNFLVDPTGNSRWWVIPVVRIDYDHDLHMQQVFAQLAEDFRAGEQWWLTPDEEAQLQEQNRWHEAVNVIEETLLQALDHTLPEADRPRLTASEVLMRLGYSRPTNAQARECGTALRRHLGPPRKIKGIQKWQVPLPEEFPSLGGES